MDDVYEDDRYKIVHEDADEWWEVERFEKMTYDYKEKEYPENDQQ